MFFYSYQYSTPHYTHSKPNKIAWDNFLNIVDASITISFIIITNYIIQIGHTKFALLELNGIIFFILFILHFVFGPLGRKGDT